VHESRGDSFFARYAPGFRRGLWTDADAYVEIWSEANSMMGVLWPVASELDVYVRPAGGFSSETFWRLFIRNIVVERI
jgi:hypothetical protein